MQSGGGKKMLETKLEIFKAGYCTHKEKIALKNGSLREVKFPAMFALIEHPKEGYVLFDTGYASLFEKETKKFPYNIYAKITPVFFEEEESALNQVKKIGVDPKEIKKIFISHFHADHIAGLKEFPEAHFICSKRAYKSIENEKGFSALVKAYIPDLLPNNFDEKVTFIEESKRYIPENETEKDLENTFGKLYDVFGDGSFVSMDLSGHAEGQFGLFLKNEKEYSFLVADAVWRSKSYKENIKPLFPAKIIMSDSKEYKENFEKIVKFYKMQPDVFIIPSHCEDVYGGRDN